ncbi:uncharacterized protein [Henckelia pumila]|uniref:uncharacterized protein n=1 Tax=Henckelia pumila TaxID=405737 RepID=UPI003C6DCDC5
MVISVNKVYIDLLSSKVHKGTGYHRFLSSPSRFDESILDEVEIPVYGIEEPPWTLKFDGSSTEGTPGGGIVIISPTGVKTTLSFNLDFSCTNNQADYEALVIGLEILQDLQAKNIQVIGDSQLVLRQVAGEYKCTSLSLIPYFSAASQLADDFEKINFQKKNHPSIIQKGLQVETFNLDVNLAGDWREELKEALQFPEKSTPCSLRMKVLSYVLVKGDLYRKDMDGLLLRCIGFPEAMEVMKQVHEGVCGAPQLGIKMRWLVRRRVLLAINVEGLH